MYIQQFRRKIADGKKSGKFNFHLRYRDQYTFDEKRRHLRKEVQYFRERMRRQRNDDIYMKIFDFFAKTLLHDDTHRNEHCCF